MNTPVDPMILERNLALIATRSPRAAQQIRDAKAHRGFAIVETDEGVVSGTLDGRALASKRRPRSEAEKFAAGYDPTEAAGACVLGFGIGHHCQMLMDRVGSKGVVVCFEPDVELLRAVFEHVDHSSWLGRGRFLLTTDADDAAVLSQLLSGSEAVVSLGVQILEHPASIARLGESRSRFSKILTEVLRASRTQVVTTLAHAPVSFRNMLMNLEYYASCAGVEQLRGATPGATAVVVAAGPSLAKNLDQLGDPRIRSRVVVIAAQTVLKPMLDRGIRPDFVTALDFHELSKRFYEGLTADDVAGIRLVVEPKANPAILDAFPGEIICIKEPTLDTLLGEDLAREMGELPNGGTVAHLSYYLARHLGCDPVIMIGQDLGFTDGQYYAADAAIHGVWAGELNAHNTLEMMEWQRIARMKSLLRAKTDIHGNQIFTDEQMATYLAQFESDFLRDTERGLRIIDATEGGVSKRHTETMALSDALAGIKTRPKVHLPETKNCSGSSREQVIAQITRVVHDAEMIRRQSDKTIRTLTKMLDANGDQAKIGRLIDQVNAIRDKVMDAKCAYKLVEFINQTGVLKRFRADRAIEIEDSLSPIERQHKQIQRDIGNVEWTRDAAEELASQLCNAQRVLKREARKVTRDEPGEATTKISSHGGGRVEALIVADPEFNGLGLACDLEMPIANGMNALQITVGRLLRCQSLDGITIMTPSPDRVAQLLGDSYRQRVHIARCDGQSLRERTRSIGIARHQASDCWRGGIGSLTCYDEGFDPRMVYELMEQRSLSAVAVVGSQWTMVDPQLVDIIVERHTSSPEQHRLAFSQAVPGVGAFVVDRSAIENLGKGQATARSFASIGGLIGYIPIAPQADPVAKTMCVQIDPALRDAGVRAIADSTHRVLAMRSAYEQTNQDPIEADTTRCLAAFGDAVARFDRSSPSIVHLEVCSGRLSNGLWGPLKRGGHDQCERPVLTIAKAHSLLSEIIAQRPDTTLVLDGAGDPLMHHDALGFVQLGDELGFASVELRTDLLCEGVSPEAFVESGLGVLSVDLLANTPETYAALTGQHRFEQTVARIEAILDARGDAACGLGSPWIVPRITRCDAVYGEIPDFYDRWMMACGCAVIDPPTHAAHGQRISALPIPSVRQQQIESRIMRIRCDGMLVDRFGQILGERSVFDVGVDRALKHMRRHIEVKAIETKDEAAA